MFRGMTYWWPKAFGFAERKLGKRAFWFWIIGFFCSLYAA